MKQRPTMRARKISKNEISYNKNLDQAIHQIETRLSLIVFVVLHDKFDWGKIKVGNLGGKILSLKKQWIEGAISTEELLRFTELKKYNVYRKMKKIPMSQKMALARTKGRFVPGIDAYLDSAFLNVFLLMFTPLKTDYRFSNEKMDKFFDEIIDYVDSFAKGYVDDKGLIEIIKEYGYDPVTGEEF